MTAHRPAIETGATASIFFALLALYATPSAEADVAVPGAALSLLPSAPSAVITAAASASSAATPESAEGEDDNPYESADQPVHPAAPRHRAAFEVRDGMVHVPAGAFTMGTSNRMAPQNERPARHLAVASFWMDRTEVTVSSYAKCVADGLCQEPPQTASTCTYRMGDPSLPISCVRWADADSFCQAQKKRLPTEAEWEFAARGPQAVRFPWGGGMSSCGMATTLISDMSGRSCVPHPVSAESKPQGASPFGILNMTGNVEEWTADWYTESPGGGPSPRVGTSHVLRGGGWLSWPSMSTTTSRNWGSALEAGPNAGFRCARDND